MVTNKVLVYDAQHFLFVYVHLFVSFLNSKVHAVVNKCWNNVYLCLLINEKSYSDILKAITTNTITKCNILKTKIIFVILHHF